MKKIKQDRKWDKQGIQYSIKTFNLKKGKRTNKKYDTLRISQWKNTETFAGI